MKERRISSVHNVSSERGRRTPAWWGLAAIVVVAGVIAVGCSAKAAKGKPGYSPSGTAASYNKPAGRGAFGRGPASIPVQAVDVQYGTLSTTRNAAATVVPVTQSNVAAQVSGVVQNVLHQAGDWVTAGEVVVQLDPSQLQLAYNTALGNLKNAQISLQVGEQNVSLSNPQLQAQLQAAQAALSAAQRNFSATQAAAKIGAESASAIDTAQQQLQTAQANYTAAQTALTQNKDAATQNIAQLKVAVESAQNALDQARLNLSSASIAAPFSGQIAAVNVTPGEFVSQNTPAFILVTKNREISFSVPPGDAASLPLGGTVTFNTGGRSYGAKINVAPSAPINGVVPLTAVLTGNNQPAFGTVGTVSYTVDLTQGTLVPIAALQNNGNQNYVYTIVSGKAHMQNITILGETGATVAASGISSGSQVIINPPPGLLEGTTVSPVAATSAGSASGGQSGNANAGSQSANGTGGQKNVGNRQSAVSVN